MGMISLDVSRSEPALWWVHVIPACLWAAPRISSRCDHACYSPQNVPLVQCAGSSTCRVLVCMYRRRIQSIIQRSSTTSCCRLFPIPFLALARGRWPYTYYYGYWVTVCLSVALSFFVLQEVFRDAFRPFEALRDLSTILFRWSALVLLLVAGMSAITASNQHRHPQHVDDITGTILMVDRNVRVMLCGLVFFLLMFSEYLGISRRHVLFGVAVGFGFFAAIHMLVATAVAHRTLSASQHAICHQQRRLRDRLHHLAGYIAHPEDPAGRRNRRRKRARRIGTKPWKKPALKIPSESLLDTMDKTVAQLLITANSIKSRS